MTAALFDLTFSISAKEESDARALFTSEMVRTTSPTLYLLTHRVTLPLIEILLGFVCTFGLVHYLPRLVEKTMDQDFDRSVVLGFPLAFLSVLILGWIVRSWTTRISSRKETGPVGPEGVFWGDGHLTATREVLKITRVKQTQVYRWAAVRQVRTASHMILLMLTPRYAILIPRRAFPSKEEERRFCHFVSERIASTGPD